MNALASALALACIGLAAAASFSEPRTPTDPFGELYESGDGLRLEAQGRDCTALAVLRGATSDAWDQQATIAQTVANLVAETEAVDACDVLPLLFDAIPSMPGPHELMQWQQALAVTDAVLSGDYTVAPPQCARATSFHRAEAPTRQGVSPAPLPYCRVGSLFFAQTTSESPGVPGKGIPK